MAGHHHPPHGLQLRDHSPPFVGRAPFLSHHSVAVADDRLRLAILALEDRLESQSRESEILLMDNQSLAATHVALTQEVFACQRELRLAAADAARSKAGRDAELREVRDRATKVVAEAKGVESMRAELGRVRAETQGLAAARDELAELLQGLRGELEKARADRGQAAAIVSEIEAMQKEVHKGRAAVEYEKKAHSENIEQSQIMEQNMVKMAREVGKLRAELANLEKQERETTANPGYGRSYGNPEMSYDASSYTAAYSIHQAQPASRIRGRYGDVPPGGPYGYQQTYAPR